MRPDRHNVVSDRECELFLLCLGEGLAAAGLGAADSLEATDKMSAHFSNLSA